MKHNKGIPLYLIVVLILLLAATPASAQTGYQLSWWSVEGGAGVTSSSSYRLVGMAGHQSTGILNGGQYTLIGGFWRIPSNEGVNRRKVYLPITVR